MKSWKVMLGLGAACAACCAIPLLGLAGGLAALGSALAACADDLLPLAGALLAAALALAAAWGWRRRQARRNAACACTNACSTTATPCGNGSP
jgi:hypothetical protein